MASTPNALQAGQWLGTVQSLSLQLVGNSVEMMKDCCCNPIGITPISSSSQGGGGAHWDWAVISNVKEHLISAVVGGI
jgi:hypothetical protein